MPLVEVQNPPKTVELEDIPRPKEQADHYSFFRNKTTGRDWKVKLERVPLNPHDPSSELSATQLKICLTASPVDAEGKALRDELDRPIVTEPENYVFNEELMAQEGFDLIEHTKGLIERRVEKGEGLIRSRHSLDLLERAWKRDGKIISRRPAP